MRTATRPRPLCLAVLVAAAAARAGAQPAQRPAPRVTVAAAGGLATAATVATGRLETTLAAAPGSGLLASTAVRTVDLRLDRRATVGAEVRVRVGAARRWSLLAEVARAAGEASLARRQRFTTPSITGSPDLFATDERFFSYDRVTTWRGALGAARAFALPAGWSADASLAGVVTRLRAGENVGLCAGLAGFARAVCESQVGTSLPAFSLTAPGTAFGAAVEAPVWRRVRVRARAGADVLWADGARLVRDVEPERLIALPAGAEQRDAASGRRARVLPSASLGVAVGVGR